MKRFKIGLRYFIKLSYSDKKEVAYMFYLFIKMTLLVKMVPLKFYFNIYFKYTDDQTQDLQRYEFHFSRIKRIKRYLPWKVSCLMESMVIKAYFAKVNVSLPIYLGLKTSNGIVAHAWCIESDAKGFQPNFC